MEVVCTRVLHEYIILQSRKCFYSLSGSRQPQPVESVTTVPGIGSAGSSLPWKGSRTFPDCLAHFQEEGPGRKEQEFLLVSLTTKKCFLWDHFTIKIWRLAFPQDRKSDFFYLSDFLTEKVKGRIKKTISEIFCIKNNLFSSNYNFKLMVH